MGQTVPVERDKCPAGPIAIDGPAASGKTTVGEALAAEFGFSFLDTGLMYRAFALAALRAKVSPSNLPACAELAQNLGLRVEAGTTTRILLGKEDVTAQLRDPQVEQSVSLYSAIPEVRTVMVEEQRRVAGSGRFILAGRDIGTVVLSSAPIKIFLTASEEARANRRADQNTHSGAVAAQSARADIANRDRKDSTRAVSPLKAADDAVIIDTTSLSLEQVIERAIEEVRCAKN